MDVPSNCYVCHEGHLTTADSWDHTNVTVVTQGPPEFDYTKQCRRMVWKHVPGPVADPEVPDPYRHTRCAEPVLPIAQVPEVYAAFLVGGEDAARAIMIQEGYGSASEEQRT